MFCKYIEKTVKWIVKKDTKRTHFSKAALWGLHH